ncbi:hypothetical protein N9514_04165, partial [Pseudomonadales bacterium]|nr:hypothetical protein [Pseudomonadales bacterium]
SKNELLRFIVLGAFISSIFNYAEFLFGFDFFASNFMDGRYEYQLNSGMALIGFSILYFSGVSKFFLFGKITRLTLLTFFLGLIVVSVSRTNLGALIIILMLPIVLPRISAKTQLFGLVPIISVAIFAGSLLGIAMPESAASDFTEKVLNSGNELAVREYEGAANINHYWRSFEAFLGLREYLDAGYLGLLFGQGFGSYASASHIFDTKFEYIPIFHNGFITILLKTGILGLFLFFVFLRRIINVPAGQRKTQEVEFHSLLSIGMVWILVVNTYAIHGLYTPKINILFLFVLGYIFDKIGRQK